MTLDQRLLDHVDQQLAATDELLAEGYPGDDGRRQAVHTVYTPADQFSHDVAQRWGQQALDAVQQQGSMVDLVAQVLEQSTDDASYVERLAELVERKLTQEPIEDLRIDFEDGYGRRSDAEEDQHAVEAAKGVAQSLRDGIAPPFIGIRFKCMEADVRARGLRTLDLYLSTLVEEVGSLPDSTVLTLPKVTTVDQVKAMNDVAAALESGLGLDEGQLRYEVQVETPQLIVGAEGQAEVARVIHAGQGRITSLHYGTYDYSASLGIAAAYQAMDHPAADFAKNVMLTAVAGTGVHLSDGSTNILPLGSAQQVRDAWALHARLVARHLQRGIYQGWDLHAAQLPTRFISTFDFFNRSLDSAVERLSRYVRAESGSIMDEPATAKALARYILRSTSCGAADSSEIQQRLGISDDVLHTLAATGLTPQMSGTN
ncbi:MAG TPA: aldolase [Yaniella sp.]